MNPVLATRLLTFVKKHAAKITSQIDSIFLAHKIVSALEPVSLIFGNLGRSLSEKESDGPFPTTLRR